MNSPFDELKYKELLKGLEASEILFSYVKTQTDILRLDSFYYSKEFLSDEIIISKTTNKTLKELNASLLSFGAYSLNNFVEYKDSGIPFVRGLNMKNGVLDFSDTIYIDANAHKLLWKSEVKPNTILLSMSGTIGEVAIAVQEYQYPMNSNQDIAKIRLKRESIRPCYLYAFLRSKYGQNFLKREARGSVQQHVFLSQIETIRIPLLPDSFQLQIEQLVKSAHSNLYQSKALYSDAENMLLSEIGLQDWQPNNNPVNIKQLKESFWASGRLDAEYYQTKYDEIESVITKYKYGYDRIENLFSQNTEVCDYKEEAYNYIEIGDINIGDGSANYNLVSTENLPDNAKRVLHKNDILVSKVRPYRGAVSIIDFDDEKLIGSGAFTVLHEKTSYKKEVLQILLRTQIYKDWLLKWNVGSSYPVIKDEDIMNLPIPLFPNTVQTKIAEYVQKSIFLRNEAKHLLEEAKMMVEKEIEEGTF
ncbi:restriction endonuclease subunit S [bacterium]|nr:restriction endonuclease subunit S [bacterium]